MNKLIRRELEVAFSKKTQKPIFRILKYVVMGFFIYLFWKSKTFWWISGILLILALSLHFWYRYKTNGLTKSWDGWK